MFALHRRIALPLIACALLFAVACGTPRPEGVADAQADELAEQMLDALNHDAWRKTGAITWTFADRNNHLWDRRRRFVRVRNGDSEVFVNLRTKKGVALDDGVRLEGEDRDEAVKKAYEAWVNDSFWLIAPFKAFDSGTTRSTVTNEDGTKSLLIEYSSGGVTPGDAYLWHFDDNGRPNEWQMWVSVVPVDGVSVTWEGWTELSTGVWVSTLHDAGPLDIEVTELKAAKNVDALVDGPDPFAELLQ